MGETLSFMAGSALFVVSLMVVKEYWPSRHIRLRDMEPPTMLQLGIFVGFLLTASNTLWWQIINTIVVDQGWMTRAGFQELGRYMDVPLKGGMAVVGLIHLRAKQKMQASHDPRT